MLDRRHPHSRVDPPSNLNLEYVKAAIRVAVIARLFVWATADAPLEGMSFDQGILWDRLTDAVAVVEELEA